MNFKNSYYKKMVLSAFIFISAGAAFLFYASYAMPVKSAYGYGNSRGQYLFSYYNCLDCHIVKGLGGTLGPSLSNYGNKNKSFGWTVKQIENPQSHYKTGSEVKINGKTYYAIMPSYDYIPYGDIEKLASYLESLKK